ncbi:hypothetical protein N7491_008420 [Penicillium cf. griseofulvum]|nr:hypothetical protein N7491_008420 [Penicillium cf. griseofulvum]
MRLETFQKVLENTTTLVNLSGEDGKTAVFLAVEEGNRDVLERLSKVGAEIDCMDKKNRTPLSYAAEQGLHETVKFLVEEQNAEVDSKVCEQLTPLHGRSVEENTALILAVRHSSITTVRQLLTSEHFTIDVNQYAKGGTALSLATELELVGIMEQLIPKADVNLRDDNELKRTPLIWAVEKGKGLSVIKLLQMGGIEVNKSNTQGRTPFSLAAEKRWVDIMQMLLKRKADPHKEDMSGHTGFWWFLRARSGRPVIRVTLGRKFPMMYRSSLPELMEVLEHLEPNRQDSAGRTWLSWAAEYGDEEIIQLLLGYKTTDPNFRDRVKKGFARTPVIWAVEKHHKVKGTVSTLQGERTQRDLHLCTSPVFRRTKRSWMPCWNTHIPIPGSSQADHVYNTLWIAKTRELSDDFFDPYLPKKSVAIIRSNLDEMSESDWYETPLEFISRDEWFCSRFWKYYIQILHYMHIPLFTRPKRRPYDRIPSHFIPNVDMQAEIICAPTILVFSSVFLIAWNSHFPSATEKLLWRIASVNTLAFGLLGGLLSLYLHKRMFRPGLTKAKAHSELKEPESGCIGHLARFTNIDPRQDPNLEIRLRALVPVFAICVLYCVGRGFILTEDFIGLRIMPANNAAFHKTVREAAKSGLVLLKNEGLLPLPSSLGRIAILSPNARNPTTGVSSSAAINPFYITTPEECLTEALRNISPGVQISYKQVVAATFWADSLVYIMSDGDIPPSFKGKVYSYRVTGVVIPKISGQYTFSIANTGKAKLFVDDQLLIDNTDWTTITSEKDEDAMMQRAIQSTRESDVVILIVSHNKDSKGEGGDRTNMELPGRTNELVSSVCAANPNTIVVVQAACATAMPWANQAGAIVLGWYQG